MINNRLGRAGSLFALGAFAILTCENASAAPPLAKRETTLLGVKLMSTYRTVLAKFGQPHEIQVGSPTLPEQGQPEGTAQTAGAAPGMGALPLPGGRPGGMGGGMPGSMGGMPAGMGGGMPGSMGGGRRMGGGMPAGMGGGMPGSMGGKGGGLPGFPGSGMGGGMPGSMGGGMPGAMGGFPGAGAGPESAGAGGAQQDTDETAEATWWYHPKDKKGQFTGVHYAFLFNKEGKVIQIQQYGFKGQFKTLKGVGLGSKLGDVIRQYGWSSDGFRTGDNMLLRYGAKERLAFQLLRNQVAGITLAVVKN